MTEAKNTTALTSRIITTEDIHWKELKFLQPDSFKELAECQPSQAGDGVQIDLAAQLL